MLIRCEVQVFKLQKLQITPHFNMYLGRSQCVTPLIL